jgi:hypothetical protein
MSVRRRKATPADEGQGPAPTAEELLETSPFEDDLAEELAARPARSRPPGATLYLGAGVLLVAGFIAGVQAHKEWGGGIPAGNRLSAVPARGGLGGFGGQGGQGGFPGQGGQNGQGGGRGAGANGGTGGGMTLGTVKLVDGKTLYLQTAGGEIVQVKTGGSTTVRISKDGSLKDLKPGSTVVVRGTPGADGTMTATSVDQGGGLPAGGGAAGGARPGGG